MKQRLKQWWFALLGKHPEGVVVSIAASGDSGQVFAMVEDAVRILPERRHFVAGFEAVPVPEGVTFLPLRRGGWFSLYRQLRRALRPWRVGMCPMLFGKSQEYGGLRLAAFLRAPGKILAYNARLERHHLQFRTWLASLLFWKGVPLDRIYLRPRWLAWTTADRTIVPDVSQWIEGRVPAEGARRRRIGVLSPFVPFPLSHGGAVRLDALLREMAQEFDVYLFAFREKESGNELLPLAGYCAGIGLVDKPRYREPRWASVLPPEVREYESAPMRRMIEEARRKHSIELVQVEYTQLARYRGDILVEHDVTFDLYQQIRLREGTIAAWWDWWRWRRFERRAVRRYQRVVTMSEKDSQLLGIGQARVIPNGVDLRRFQPRAEPPGTRLLFIGSFRHFPNVIAYRFFLIEVWPRVRDVLPEAGVVVVAGPDPDLYWEAATGERAIPGDPRVTLHSFVREVRPLYEDSNIVLAPTLVSAGTNVKVLEAMAMARALVTTPSGCGGIPVEHGQHVWMASGAEAFAAGIVTLARDAELRLRLGRAARSLVEQRFDWATLGKMQRALVSELLPAQLRLREASPADIPRVREIQMQALPTSKWEVTQYLQHEFYVAENATGIIGFIVARQTAPDEREILNIAVDEAHRGNGAGVALLTRLIHSRLVPGDVFLEVRESNVTAQRLYTRVGFAEVGRRLRYYDDPEETAVIMRIPTNLNSL